MNRQSEEITFHSFEPRTVRYTQLVNSLYAPLQFSPHHTRPDWIHIPNCRLVNLTTTEAPPKSSHSAAKPNFVIIFTDDQGYGDLSCYNSETIRTPRIDSLAAEGTKFTNFYAQVVCGPSRSALLTGRYPVRSGGWSMPATEVTLAELLQEAGYRTGCIGKWDISNRAAILPRMPNAKRFDYY
jgi:hypothetical protein